MIKVVAKMKVKAEKIEEFRNTAAELVKKSGQEDGCVFYTLNQSTENPEIIAILECWKSQEALDIHTKTKHFADILPKLSKICDECMPAEIFTELEV